MTTTAAAWPRSQHWRIDGFRISVLLYKTHRARRCRTCGRPGAIHCAWSDTRPDGFSAGPADFCDQHRPAKGTLPDLDYERMTHDGTGTSAWTRTRERLRANPVWPCGACGQPSTVRREVLCDHCTDPAHYTVSTVRKLSITADGHDERTVTSIGHDPHTIATTYHCAGHSSQEAR
jgi:hypothetical protein